MNGSDVCPKRTLHTTGDLRPNSPAGQLLAAGYRLSLITDTVWPQLAAGNGRSWRLSLTVLGLGFVNHHQQPAAKNPRPGVFLGLRAWARWAVGGQRRRAAGDDDDERPRRRQRSTRHLRVMLPTTATTHLWTSVCGPYRSATSASARSGAGLCDTDNYIRENQRRCASDGRVHVGASPKPQRKADEAFHAPHDLGPKMHCCDDHNASSATTLASLAWLPGPEEPIAEAQMSAKVCCAYSRLRYDDNERTIWLFSAQHRPGGGASPRPWGWCCWRCGRCWRCSPGRQRRSNTVADGR